MALAGGFYYLLYPVSGAFVGLIFGLPLGRERAGRRMLVVCGACYLVTLLVMGWVASAASFRGDGGWEAVNASAPGMLTGMSGSGKSPGRIPDPRMRQSPYDSWVASLSVWDEFAFDPRSAQYGALRASDADREIVHRALGSAYADGRLTREEFDQRSDAVLRAKTLSELPVLIIDLVAVPGPPGRLPATTEDSVALQARAVAAYRSDRREAAWGFVSASIVCWVIWWVTSAGGGFPWPVFVMLGTGLHLLRLLVMRGNEVEQQRKRLEHKARKAQRDQQARELEPGSNDES